MNNLGPNDCFKLNKDLRNYNVTDQDFLTFYIEFRKMLIEAPDKRFFTICFVGGHGMVKDGAQWVFMNQISEKGFYKTWNIEKVVREWSE